MGLAESIRSKLNGEESPEDALKESEIDSVDDTYSSEDARYHTGLGAGLMLGGLGAASYHSFSSGRYLLGATSLGTALMTGKFFGGMVLRSYLKAAGKGIGKGYSFLSSDEVDEHPLEAAKKNSDRN